MPRPNSPGPGGAAVCRVKFNPLRRFTVTPGDGEALTERILALAGDSDLCVSLGACVVFERQWDKEQALAEWETLLQAVGYPGRG